MRLIIDIVRPVSDPNLPEESAEAELTCSDIEAIVCAKLGWLPLAGRAPRKRSKPPP